MPVYKSYFCSSSCFFDNWEAHNKMQQYYAQKNGRFLVNSLLLFVGLPHLVWLDDLVIIQREVCIKFQLNFNFVLKLQVYCLARCGSPLFSEIPAGSVVFNRFLHEWMISYPCLDMHSILFLINNTTHS